MTRLPFAAPGLVLDNVHYGAFDAPLEIDAPYAVVDTETTGLSAAAGARIVEIAVHLTPGNGTITESFSTLVNPGNGDTGAVHIHGITPAMVADAPTWSEIWPVLSALFTGHIFVAHNASFDASFINAEVQRIGASMPLMPGICSYWLARQALPGIERHNLEAVTNHLGLTNRHPHAAEGDTRVVVEALPRMLGKVDQVKHFIPTLPVLQRPEGVVLKERD